MHYSDSESAVEARARRAMRRVGLMATKTRWRRGSLDNRGGFCVVDPSTNFVIYGDRWELSAEDVLELAKNHE